MAGFKFKLERVLNYKGKIEDFKKAEHAEKNIILNNEKEKLDFYNSYKEEIISKKSESLESITIGQVRMYNNYLKTLSATIVNQEEVVENAKDDLTKAKDELIVAMQEKKTFERLKEIDYEEFLNEEKKEEEKMIDTIVTFNTKTQL